jgi:hypothetical protein
MLEAAFPGLLIVIGMGEEVQKVKPSLVKMNSGNEPEVVSSNVENNDRAQAADFDKVGMRKVPSHFGKSFPGRFP